MCASDRNNVFIGHDFCKIWWLLKEPFVCVGRLCSLTAKSVQSAALSLQSVHHIHGCHSLSLGVLRVCHSITDHVLKENFENTTSLLVDQSRDSLDTATASKTTDSRLGDALNVVPKDLSVTLGASFS